MIIDIFLGIVIFIAFLWAAFTAESDKVATSLFGTFFILAVVVGVAQYLYGFGSIAWSFILANPFVVFAIIVGYFAIGALYVLLWRYSSYLNDNADNIKEMYAKWKQKFGDTSKTEQVNGDEFVESSDEYRKKYGPGSMKSVITGWIIWWPLSLVYHLSYRPVKYVTEKIYQYISDWLIDIFKKSGKNIIK